MTVEELFAPMMATAVTGVIGFLIKHSFQKFETKLDAVVNAVSDIREKHGERLTALETDIDWLTKMRKRMSVSEPEPKRER